MQEKIAADLRIGAGPIAEEVFGEDTPETRRKVYYGHEKRQLPTFLYGNQLALRPSTYRQQLAEQERAAAIASATTEAA